ncbi:MAG: galactokinase [Oscillospiraceae bacterium]|jgi:galactokinase|nr:galactokinase [Oscillospiraceae bacterium]
MRLEELREGLRCGRYREALARVYGDDIARQEDRLLALCDDFAERFAAYAEHVAVFSAPGRSEIGGNHTDHNHGKVLACGINLDVVAIAAKTDEPRVLLKSRGYPLNEVELDALTPVESELGHSNAMIRGICAGMRQRGHAVGGFCAVTTSEVLGGSGLSSSAAFEVLVCTILNEYYNEGKLRPLELAKISQYAENIFVGKPSGLLDQTACAVGGFVQIDFEDTEAPVVSPVAYDFTQSGHALCIVDTGGSHADLTDDYAAVRREMEAVAGVLGKRVLRETSRRELLHYLPMVREQAGERAALRALHFFAENERVEAQAAALEHGDFAAFLRLIKQSGQSSFMYNQNVFTPKQAEQPVALALGLSETILGARGAWRVHGGGFAGTIQAFVPLDMLEEYRQAIESVFGPGSCYVLRVRECGGVRVL